MGLGRLIGSAFKPKPISAREVAKQAAAPNPLPNKKLLDNLQKTLNVTAMIPGLRPISKLPDAGFKFAEGNTAAALFVLATGVPGVGGIIEGSVKAAKAGVRLDAAFNAVKKAKKLEGSIDENKVYELAAAAIDIAKMSTTGPLHTGISAVNTGMDLTHKGVTVETLAAVKTTLKK